MKYYQKCVKFAYNYSKNSSASGGLRPAGPLPGLCPWTPLGTPVPQTTRGFAPAHPKPPSAAYELYFKYL